MKEKIKNDIIDKVIKEFNKDKHILKNAEFEKTGLDGPNSIFDGLVRFRYHKRDLEYHFKIHNNVNNTVIGILAQQKKNIKVPILLISGYINNKKAEELRGKKIQFIDAAGNAYIDNYPIYIFIKGNKPDKGSLINKRFNIFEPGGLKIIYVLLINPENIKKPYRDIAEIAGVSLGTAAGTIKDLNRQGYVIMMGQKIRKLLNKKNLFNRWCIEFNERLRPKLLIDRFTGPNNWWREEILDPAQAQWGGEVAANKLIGYTKPNEIIIYTDTEKYKKIVIKNRLRKDEEGDIAFFNRFWHFSDCQDVIADPILVYSDLLNTGDQRAVEVAKEIYEEYIDKRFRQDR